MELSDKIYTGLCIFFGVLVVLGNIIYQKFVSLPLFSFYTFELSVGAILYPLTYFTTDLITEFYGKEKVTFCVRCSIAMNIMVAVIITFMDWLPATSWSKIDSLIFHRVFGMYRVAFLASITACYISQSVDIFLYVWIKKITRGKYLWLRNNGSTAISLLIDTSVVITTMTLFGILPKDHSMALIGNSYLWKLFFSIACTPFFYGAFNLIKNMLGDEKRNSYLLQKKSL